MERISGKDIRVLRFGKGLGDFLRDFRRRSLCNRNKRGTCSLSGGNAAFTMLGTDETFCESNRSTSTVTEVHPSLDEDTTVQAKSISNETLSRLAKTVLTLKDDKKQQLQKLQELATQLIDLWNLMDIPDEERELFVYVTCNISASVDELTELLADMDSQIAKAKEEAVSRKDILDRVEKWMSACEEESWLEDYNRDQNRYSASRDAHLNLKKQDQNRYLWSYCLSRKLVILYSLLLL
ncbi:hypothetical protein Rs2_08688 [Raphanus sativus]|nr:hypothetical protein Rs2_08688 [Raphanus sativus]